MSKSVQHNPHHLLTLPPITQARGAGRPPLMCKQETHRISISFPDYLFRAIREFSDSSDLSFACVCREMIERYLEMAQASEEQANHADPQTPGEPEKVWSPATMESQLYHGPPIVMGDYPPDNAEAEGAGCGNNGVGNKSEGG